MRYAGKKSGKSTKEDMSAIEIDRVSKSFGVVRAVDDVSFNVARGEIFGLLGPNGAGKTTILRLILDIFEPDEGQIAVLDGPMNESKKARIGYMPEERGLYQDVPLERCLVYLASLKGLPQSEAKSRVVDYLERFDLISYRKKQVKELSKGMQQKAQIIATLVHEPELLMVDEPFSGLDPVNTRMVKDILRDLRESGVAIIMSTHQMHQVEELCDRILLIDHGRPLLYGEINNIRNQYAGNTLIIRTQERLPSMEGILNVETHNSTYRLTLSPEVGPADILHQLIIKNIIVERYEIAVPTLDEIFIQVIQDGKETE
jgi:ABC-2 type transport system ATP-binding protein